MALKNVAHKEFQVDSISKETINTLLGVYTRPSFYKSGIEDITGTLENSGKVTLASNFSKSLDLSSLALNRCDSLKI